MYYLIILLEILQKLQERCDSQVRNMSSLEERCASLKSTIDQLNSSLERSAVTESELRSEIQSLQRTLLDTSQTSQSSSEKLKQVFNICNLSLYCYNILYYNMSLVC